MRILMIASSKESAKTSMFSEVATLIRRGDRTAQDEYLREGAVMIHLTTGSSSS
jgi:hypothetical protein